MASFDSCRRGGRFSSPFTFRMRMDDETLPHHPQHKTSKHIKNMPFLS